MFKYALVVVIALCLKESRGMSDEMQELIDNLHNTCTAETGATDAMIENARKGNFADDENFKCYFKCIFDQMGCMTDDGKVDAEAVIALLPPEVAAKAAESVRKCQDVGASPCETAWLANKCYYAGTPETYFIP